MNASPPKVFLADTYENERLFQLSVGNWRNKPQITVVHDGESAIEKLNFFLKEKAIPSLIVLSYNLPRKDALELIEFIRSKLEWMTPIVVVSAALPEATIENIFKYKDTYLISRPVDYMQFKEEIAKLESLITVPSECAS
jgi:CheY-like chemotaxis protein